jgi:hypothetical protein
MLRMPVGGYRRGGALAGILDPVFWKIDWHPHFCPTGPRDGIDQCLPEAVEWDLPTRNANELVSE